ncbi:MAG TPA: hypothetical protein VF339_15125 [Gammaproteobacteria bacterium]
MGSRGKAACARYAAPPDVLDALARVLDDPRIERIAVVYRPWYVASHLAFIGARLGSVTRFERIYTNIPEPLFFRLDGHVLHEYFHVVQQWGRERMTRLGYLLNCRRREREAADFVAANLARYIELRAAAARRRAATTRGG